MTMRVTTGSVAIDFENSTDWFPSMIFYATSGISVTPSSVNGGPVLNIIGANPGAGGDFFGGFHGASTVLNTHLTVDGITRVFQNGDSFTGRQATFSRTLKYHDFFQVEHVLHMKNNEIHENFVVRSLTNSTSGIAVFYGSLNARQNRFTDFYAYNKSGQLIGSGLLVGDDDSQTANYSAVEVHNVDPTPSGCRIIQRIRTDDDSPGLVMFIVDRSYDNKVYWRFTGYQTSQNNRTYSWSSETRFQ